MPSALSVSSGNADGPNDESSANDSKYLRYISSVLRTATSGASPKVVDGTDSPHDDQPPLPPPSMFTHQLRKPCMANGVAVQSVSTYIREHTRELAEQRTDKSIMIAHNGRSSGDGVFALTPGARSSRRAISATDSASALVKSVQPKFNAYHKLDTLDTDLDAKILSEANTVVAIGGDKSPNGVVEGCTNHLPPTSKIPSPFSRPKSQTRNDHNDEPRCILPGSGSHERMSLIAARANQLLINRAKLNAAHSKDRDGGDVGITVISPAGPNQGTGGYAGSFINQTDEATASIRAAANTALRQQGFRAASASAVVSKPLSIVTVAAKGAGGGRDGGWLTSNAAKTGISTASHCTSNGSCAPTPENDIRPSSSRYMGFMAEAVNHPLAQRQQPSYLKPFKLQGPSPISEGYRRYIGRIVPESALPPAETTPAISATESARGQSVGRPKTAGCTAMAAGFSRTPKAPSHERDRFALDVITPLDISPTGYGMKAPPLRRPSTTGGCRRGATATVAEVVEVPTVGQEGHDVYNTAGIDGAAPPHDYHFV